MHRRKGSRSVSRFGFLSPKPQPLPGMDGLFLMESAESGAKREVAAKGLEQLKELTLPD
jgi:hypothetical protein